jgi:hypothetical protein
MVSIPQIVNLQCNEAIGAARFWVQYRANQSGWLLVENLSTSDTIRVHFNEAGNDASNFKEVKPLHSKPFQIDEGDLIWFSSAVTGTQVRVENAKYKPVIDEYFIDEAAVENVPFYVDGVNVTTTYNCTTLQKGYCTQFQVGCEAAGFTGTVEYSSDNAVTYSSAVTLDIAQPLKQIFEEKDRVVTHIRVTVTAGTFFIWYR